MEEYIQVSGKTVEDAVLQASIKLETSSDNIEYRVLERETKGFLGIGAKKALIEARIKTPQEDVVREVFSSKKVQKPKQPELKQKETKQSETKQPEIKKPQTKQTEAKQKAASPEEEKIKAPRLPADPDEAKRRAEKFLTEMFTAMEMDVKIDQSFADDTLSIELSGDDMGVLIGKRGQTLDSIQYLTSLVVNKGKSSYVRVKMDTENYRERRKATLENLAKNIAFKVKKTRRPVYLEPMNPYERRIIHSALQNDPYVTTHSEGEEPCRKVVVTLKKRERAYQPDEDGED